MDTVRSKGKIWGKVLQHCQIHRLAIRIFFCMAVFITLIISFLFFVQNRERNQTAREACFANSQVYLQGVIQNTDLLFNGLNQNISQFLSNTNVQSLLYAHSIEEYPTNRVRLIMSEIEGKNLQINNMILYLQQSNTVITSTSLSSDTNNAYRELINAYLNNTIYMDKIVLDGIVFRLFVYDNKLIMVRSLPFENNKSIATLFCILNENSVYRQLSRESDVYIFNSQSQSILTDAVAYTAEIQGYLKKMRQEKLTVLEDEKENQFISMVQSDSTQWYYLYVTEDFGRFHDPYSAPQNRHLLLFLSLETLLLILAGCTAYFVESPYMNAFRKLAHSRPYAGSSLSYINESIDAVWKRNTELEDALKKVRPDVMYRLFSNLLVGMQYQSDDVRQLLNSVGSPFSINEPYFVCVIRGKDQIYNLKERKKFARILRSQSDEFCRKHEVTMQVLHVNNDIIIVSAVPKAANNIAISKCITSLKELLKTLAADNDFCLNFETGRVYFSLLDIFFSYQDALEYLKDEELGQLMNDENTLPDGIQPAAFETNARQAEPPVAEKEPKADCQRSALEGHALQLLNLIYEKDSDSAKILLERVWDEIIEDSSSLSCALKECYDFCSLLMNTLFAHDTCKNLPIPQDLFSFIGKNTNFFSKQELKQYFEMQGTNIIEQLMQIVKKQQNHHLILAQKFIQENFSDSMLSLSSIASEINMNTSYLSKLFKTSLGINFVDYVNDYRISKSRKLLTETTVPVKEISHSCGFNSVQNFIRVFKKYTGTTPGQYRSRNQNSSSRI